MRTSELTGAALDWAVAEIENPKPEHYRDYEGLEWEREYSPSTDWAQGGPIIEREKIQLSTLSKGKEWRAALVYGQDHIQYGPTPLVAAMRCYVASKLGEEVEIPDLILDGEKS